MGEVYAIDAQSQQTLWSYVPDAVHRDGDPILVNQSLIFHTDPPPGYPGVETFYALDKHTGQLLWKEARASGDYIHSATLFGNETDNLMYYIADIATQQFELRARDASTGAPVWTYSCTGNGSLKPVLAKDILYYYCPNPSQPEAESLFVVDAATGTELDSLSLPFPPIDARHMTPSNDVLYFSDVGQWLEYDGRVKAYDVTNGELLWQSSELGSFWSPVVIASGHVLTPMASPESTSLVVWQSTVPVEDNVAEPILDPPAGIYTNQVNITISTATEDGTIYYTLDGTVPHPGLPGTHHYLHPFTLFESATVRARAHKEGYLPSDVASADYVVTKPMVAKPVLVPGGGEFEGQVNITMSTATEGALIYYTLDGTTPDPSNATTRHYLIPSRSSRAPESRPGP